ncbi:MAG: hypothetical protein A3K23_01835 [Desulfobacca sp. RBG_16_58_9]|nr:MAG: hypothetical protein A3K23_01835 [Desulfobacca sp. RBG_16_58_9]
MLRRVLLTGFLIMSLLAPPVRADEFGLAPKGAFDALPSDIVNVALPEFGQDLIIPGDYGLGNVTPVEEVFRGTERIVRIFRSPELRISHRRPAEMQVLLGNVRGLYVWLNTPPLQGEWTLSIDLLYADGTRKNIFGKKMKPGVRDFVYVEPHTQVACHLSTKTTAVKVPLRFILTLSPVMYTVWPDLLPMPYRSIFD